MTWKPSRAQRKEYKRRCEELIALMEKYGGKELEAMITDLRYCAEYLERKKR